MKKQDKFKKELAHILLDIDDPDLMLEFLRDLFTPVEFQDVSKRLQIVKRLSQGESQRKIAKDLNLGIATVTRGSHELKNKKGGFVQVLEKIYGKH